MKKYLYHIAALACATVALAGCIQNEEWTIGTAIRFGAAAQAGSLTRTEYGTIVDGSPRKQMVNWCAGDTLRIVCAQASTDEAGTSTSADYKTSAGVRYNNSAESRATLSLTGKDKKGLRWGSADVAHVFYAVYPSPAAKSGDALTTAGALTGSIPAVQKPDSINNASPYKALPDMKNQYMVAKRTVEAGKQKIEDNEVFLYFTPITTAIQFGIKNNMDSDLAIQSIEISSASKNLSGTFTTSLTGLNEDGGKPYPAVTAGNNATKAAAVSFGTTGLTLAEGDSLTFTIFLLPESDLADLTFRIKKVGGGYIQTPLKYNESTWIPFGRCQKHFINGLLVNEGAKWTLAFSPDVDNWDNATGIDQNLEDPALGSLPSLIKWSQGEVSDLNMTESGKYVFALTNGTSDASHTFSGDMGEQTSSQRVKTIPITSTLDDGIQGWKIKSVGGVSVSGAGTSYTTADGDLKVEKNTAGKLVITDMRKKISYGDNDHWTTSGIDWYRAPLSGTIDLSKRDFRTGNTISMTTANCYIVRNAGTYKIPLVYGNAIDYGKSGLTNGVNTQAYAPTIASGGSDGLTPFVNHLGFGIIDPYIENNTSDGQQKCNITSGPPADRRSNDFLIAAKAELVWSEVSNLITVTSDIKGTKKTQGDNAYVGGNYDSGNVRWIEFSVSNTNICQCNAIIAVKDANSKIMWSWHIWITNNPALGQSAISVTNNAGTISSFLAAPALGYIDPDLYEKKDDVVIVLEQEESGDLITVTAKQSEYKFTAQSLLYQFGRKDPMRYGITSDINTGTVDIKTSILNPGSLYTAWKADEYYNLWTGKESKTYSLSGLLGSNSDAEEDDNKIKTIYDPSPAGYKVPSVKAFTGFTKDGQKCGGSGTYQLSDSNFSGTYHNGWDFYTSSSKSSTIYFPVFYWRDMANNGVSSTSAIGRYRTSTVNSDSNNGSFEFQFYSSYVYPMTEKSSRANALSLRPITE